MKYYAVALVTESTDHYVLLVKGSTPEAALKQVVKSMGEELGYVWNVNVDSEDPENTKALTKLINRAIENAELPE